MNLSGKKVLITGGTSGIGLKCAEDFLKAGATVTVSGSNDLKLRAALDFLAEFGRAHGIVKDMADLDNSSSLFDEAIGIMGGVDALVCSAGISSEQLTIRVKLPEWQNVINVNLSSVFLLNQKACIYFMKQRKGKIVNISSILASRGTVAQAAYCASKGGIESMTRALSMEFASRGVNINCVAPGYIATPMTDKMNEKTKDIVLNAIPMGRIGEPADVSGAVLFLCSDMSSYITGQVVHINGGMYFS